MEPEFHPDLIDEGLWLGREPRSPEDWAALATLGVTDVVTLMPEEESFDLGVRPTVAFRLAMAHRMAMHRFEIPDASTDALVARTPAVLARIESLRGQGRQVYLHCRHGLYRSATVAAAWIAKRTAVGADEAAREVERLHDPCLPDRAAIRKISGKP